MNANQDAVVVSYPSPMTDAYPNSATTVPGVIPQGESLRNKNPKRMIKKKQNSSKRQNFAKNKVAWISVMTRYAYSMASAEVDAARRF